MAKPTSGEQVPPWADAGNYAAGGLPYSSQPRRVATNLTSFASSGLTPEQPDNAESMNEWLARVAIHCQWLYAGSSADDEDAHVVETASDGKASLAYAQVGSHSTASISLQVDAPTSGGTTILATGDTGAGRAVLASKAAGAGSTIRATHAGTGSAIEALCSGSNTAPAMLGTGSATSGSVGVKGAAGGAANTVGVFGEASANSGSWGVRGLATTSANNIGVRGEVPASGASTSYGVHGLGGSGAGNGVLASISGGGTGYALYVLGDTSSPATAAMFLAPQDTEPSGGGAEGDIYANSTDNTLRYRDKADYQALHMSPYGFVGGAAKDDSGGSTAGGPATIVQLQFTPNDNQSSRTVVLIANVEVTDFAADNNVAQFDLYDDTAGSIVPGSVRVVHSKFVDSGAELTYNGGNPGESVTVMAVYTLPSTATRDIFFRVTANTGTVTWDDASIVVFGAF